MTGTAVYDFGGKVALITGGVGGLGFATAIGFARSGARVAIVGRNPERGQAAQAEIAAAGSGALYIQSDVSQRGAAKQIVDAVVGAFGRLDFAINNVALEVVNGPKSIVDTPDDEYDQFMDTNVHATFDGMKHQIPAILRTAGGGAIVNMTTPAGTGPIDQVANLYGASRYAAVGLTTNAARDWAGKGIRINAVLPGVMMNRASFLKDAAEMLLARHPIGRFGQPEDVTDAVLWLCSDHSSFVVGHILNVDGGLQLHRCW